MRVVRLIVEENNAYWNMAADEALLLLRGLEKSPDTLRLYVFNPSAVSVGYFQSLKDSLNLQQLSEKRVSVVRRISGGGAVFHDAGGEITYSIVMRTENVPKDYVESFKYLALGIIKAIQHLGGSARFVPLNDIVVNGKKISGSAQARKLGAILQHGTLMYATDLELLASLITPPKEKLAAKKVVSITERVTTLERALGRKIEKEEVIKALIKGFSEALNTEILPGQYTEKELTLIKSLIWKYRNQEWTRLRP